MKGKTFLLCIGVIILTLSLQTTPAHAAPRQQASTTPNAEALVLVNSSSSAYPDFQHFIQPYLDQLGVPYTVLDIATTAVGSDIEDYAVILVGHRLLDAGTTYLDATEEGYISMAVANGTGLINFDNDLSSNGNTGRYIFIADIFGYSYTSQPSGADVDFPTLSHYITEYHYGGEDIETATMTLADITLPSDVTAIANAGGDPFLAITEYGEGRAVQWGSYDWMSHNVLGPVSGLDDLVWRSIVWAARKPFVMQGMPPFVTFRLDDDEGPFDWVHAANDYGYKPWIGFFLNGIDETEATDLQGLVAAGNATASIHSFDGDTWFYFNHTPGTNFDDTTVTVNFTAGSNWHTTHNIPISKLVIAHYYELGTNVFDELLDWGVEFVGIPMLPGQNYEGNVWLEGGPFRLNGETETIVDEPAYYADFLEIPGHSELDNQIFNCLSEPRDVTGYDWYPYNDDIPHSIRQGTAILGRGLSAMQLATLYTHYSQIVPISDANFRAMLSGINANIAGYNPEFVTLDYACQYVRAMYTSDITQADYNPNTRELSVSFSGTTDMDTRFYVFTESAGVITHTLASVEQFSDPATVNLTLDPTVTYSLWDLTPTVGDDSEDGSAANLGVKFRSSQDGYITGLRFYKHELNTGTHVGILWTDTGIELDRVTFTNETDYGWQEATFAAPIPIYADTLYVASYYAPTGHYASTPGYFTADYENPPLTAPASDSVGGNGVYAYGATAFPNQTSDQANYWVDVVFATDIGPDTSPPRVISRSPAPDSSGADIEGDVTATFIENINPDTVSSSTFELRDPSNALISAVISYDAGTRTATLNPDIALDHNTTYQATLQGGTGGIIDLAGNPLANDVTWSFITATLPPEEGTGGPILIITDANNLFTYYYAEILRTEGLNAFFVADISEVDATFLADYDVVILSEMALTSGQVTLLTDWVNAGGNLIAMRPDAQLAGLLGLTSVGTTLSNTYLLVDTIAAPGEGIVGETMQYHGTADAYTLNGATALAMLYADATTPTSYPAATTRNVGANGGQAMAFTFDLARSIVYTRQGNPAWAGDERDGTSPIRSDDMFYGDDIDDPQPDWVNLDKVAIPQADEQQRWLANMITWATLDRIPLPRFWYFPRGEKAVVVMTGDDHNSDNIDDRFDYFISRSPTGCSVDDWECIRATAYTYPNNLFGSQAAAYEAEGFETAVHVTSDCEDYTTIAELAGYYTDQLDSFAVQAPDVSAPTTVRFHCVVWSDWDSQPLAQLAHGIRLDTDYYYRPTAWVDDRPGMFTGSGMPMRFAQQDGTMIDVYQATTQMSDEAEQTYPYTVDTLLDRALGTEGYYGAFVANIHIDNLYSQSSAEHIITSAINSGVPVVSARQLLTWWDGHNTSSFRNLSWSGNTLNFSVSAGAGANGLQAMVPVHSAVGPLSSITLDGSPVTYSVETIKGVEYAFFTADVGVYVANYTPDTVGPVISDVSATPDGISHAIVTWTTDQISDSRVDYGTTPAALTHNTSARALVTAHSIELSGLSLNTTYYYRVTSKDRYGNTTTYPPLGVDPLNFKMPEAAVTDTSVDDFGAGTLTCTYVAATDDGEIILAPTVGAEFYGTTLPTGWTEQTVWQTGGTSTVSGGQLIVNGALVVTDASYAPGRVLEFEATFGEAAWQHVGFGQDLSNANHQSWAIFSTHDTTYELRARTLYNGGAEHTMTIPGDWLGSPHLYRIEWLSDRVLYYIDGVLQHTENIAISASMRPVVSDDEVGGSAVSVDWMRMSPYATPCTFESRIFDAGGPADWLDLDWTGQQPSNTTVAFETRTGNTPSPDGSWSEWGTVNSPIVSPIGQYMQYRATLSTSSADQTPAVDDVTITYNNVPTAVTLAWFTATAEENRVYLEWETAIELDNLGFNLYRSETVEGPYTKLNTVLIPTQNPGSVFGAIYTWLDTDVQPGITYYYKLEDIDTNGIATLSEPVRALLEAVPTALKVQSFVARNSGGYIALGLIAMAVMVTISRKRRV
ncbi:MAG: DUF4082 domain-containing protein [Anaerolineae bacterium]|nr:DUF4082 domain-containing protein [Anaerolineae bacterium]